MSVEHLRTIIRHNKANKVNNKVTFQTNYELHVAPRALCAGRQCSLCRAKFIPRGIHNWNIVQYSRWKAGIVVYFLKKICLVLRYRRWATPPIVTTILPGISVALSYETKTTG